MDQDAAECQPGARLQKVADCRAQLNQRAAQYVCSEHIILLRAADFLGVMYIEMVETIVRKRVIAGGFERLWVDVYGVASASDLPADNALPATLPNQFAPGAKSTLNVVRVYYRWPVMVDYLRLLSPNSSLGKDHVLMATAVIQNEDF